MGIKGLNYFLKLHTKDAITETHLSKYKNKKIAIDANLYLYKFLYNGKNHLHGLFFQICKFKKYDIKPIYIFDGIPPDEKKKTLDERYNHKNKIKNKIKNLQNSLCHCDTNVKLDIINKIKNLKSNLIYINKEVIYTTIELFNYMGIHYIFAPCESEHYCVKLIKYNIVDLVLSEDMDTVGCGSLITLREYSNKKDYVMEYDFNKILNILNITNNQFIDLCILFSNDYIKLFKYIDVHKCYHYLQTYTSLDNIVKKKIISTDIVNINKIRNIYKLKDIHIEDTIISYINTFLKPNIYELKQYLCSNTTIYAHVYKNIIYKVYYLKRSKFKHDCFKSGYYHKLRK